MYFEEVNLNNDEIEFYKFLRKHKNNDDILLTNLLINKEFNYPNQLNFVLINKKGIFIIEKKNYHGLVYGDESSKEWSVSYEHNEIFKFDNPLKENNARIKTIQLILARNKLEKLPIYNMVVFNNDSNLENIVTSNAVVKEKNFFNTIKKYPNTDLNRTILLGIKNIILSENIKNRKKLEERIDNSEDYISDDDYIENNKSLNYFFIKHQYIFIAITVTIFVFFFAMQGFM